MKDIKYIQTVPFPDINEPVENFSFDCVCTAGTFSFHFKWLNDRWNVWVTLPNGEVREAGVYPNVISWTGFTDYGLVFKSSLKAIDFKSLLLAEITLIKWE